MIVVEMRRKDRQMPESFAWEVVDKCEYAFLGMTAEDGSPYVLPLTIVRDGREVYFHSAMKGRKTHCLREHPRVCLTCVGNTQLQPEHFTTLYESAILFGTAAEVTDEAEKARVLRILCQRHAPSNMADFEREVAANLKRTAIWKIVVEEITGKAKL